MRKLAIWIMMLLLAGSLTACGQKDQEETAADTETQLEAEEVSMEDLNALLGMKKEEAAQCFGGAGENWTEDKSSFISHVFEVELQGQKVTVHATYDDQDAVNSLSVWLTDGETPLSEETVQEWIAYLTDYADHEADFDDTSSEGGSKIFSWKLEGGFMKLYWLGDTLSVSINPAVGELK